MRYAQLGRSGLTVSVIGLGCNNFGPRVDLSRTDEVVGAALDDGITLVDTADAYGDSEELLGRVLKGRRHEVVLATKFGLRLPDRPAEEARGSRRYIRFAVEASLRRLGTDWIDLYQFHRPDPLTPIEETLAALTELVQAGLVRYIGCSNFSAAQLVEAVLLARQSGLEHVVSVQNQYNLLHRQPETEVLPMAERYGVGFLPFFPLANGLLTGKYEAGRPPEAGRLAEPAKRELFATAPFEVLDRLRSFAEDRGLSMVDVAIGGLLARRPVASVIAGATRVEQVHANAAASGWQPDPEEVAELDTITRGPAD
jgi:aryl-alcohol dehydrogenase-like predicted oxidoreductase